ncbi:MAG: hypothetical protein JWR26_4992 [Pedosphaera sp.]|nr:hypothetical protein [Pedosphaera sp.]
MYLCLVSFRNPFRQSRDAQSALQQAASFRPLLRTDLFLFFMAFLSVNAFEMQYASNYFPSGADNQERN